MPQEEGKKKGGWGGKQFVCNLIIKSKCFSHFNTLCRAHEPNLSVTWHLIPLMCPGEAIPNENQARVQPDPPARWTSSTICRVSSPDFGRHFNTSAAAAAAAGFPSQSEKPTPPPERPAGQWPSHGPRAPPCSSPALAGPRAT